MNSSNNNNLVKYITDALGHANAAMRKAAQFRQDNLNQYYKSAELAPQLADALIKKEFISPDNRDAIVQRLTKQASALEVLQCIVDSAVPEDKTRNDFGKAVKTAGYSGSKKDQPRDSDLAWRRMIYN